MATSRTWLLRNRILPGGEEKEKGKKNLMSLWWRVPEKRPDEREDEGAKQKEVDFWHMLAIIPKATTVFAIFSCWLHPVIPELARRCQKCTAVMLYDQRTRSPILQTPAASPKIPWPLKVTWLFREQTGLVHTWAMHFRPPLHPPPQTGGILQLHHAVHTVSEGFGGAI